MATFSVQMPDGSVRQVQGTTLAAAINNAGAGASAPSAAPTPAASAAPAAPAPSAAGTLPQTVGGGATYQTINGPRTVDQMLAELRGVGWGGPAGGTPLGPGSIANAYAQTAGGSVTEMPGQNYGAAAQVLPTVPGAPVVPTADFSGLLGQINSALGTFGAQASGVTQAELAERKRQFDQTLEWQKQMWQNQGLPQLVIQQRAQQLAEQEFQSQKALAEQAQAMQAAGLTGTFQGAPTMAAQQQAFAQEQARAGLGLQYLQSAAALGGPENVFQSEAFLRGAAANPQLPAFLQSLQANTRMPVFNAPGPAPNVLSAGSIANRLTGGAANTAGISPTAALGAIQGINTAGAQKLAPGTLEQLTPDELASFGSGLKAVGGSLPAFLEQYRQSRLGQGAIGGDIGLSA
jgi:hypothetical protein